MMKSPIKHLINQLFSWRTTQKIENLAVDIARQCRSRVTQQVISKSKTLPPEQLRGYVRAYATGCLESVAKQRVNTEQLNPCQISKVILQAKEFLIEMVIRDMQSMPPAVVGDIAAAA